MEEELPIFVYGTLLPGQANAHLWEGNEGAQMSAVLENGRLYDLGYFPMLVEEAGQQVQGVVLTFQSDAYSKVLALLDNLEGYDPQEPEDCAYQRVSRKVRLKNGRQVAAWVYLGQAQYTIGCPSVPHGDWAAYSLAKSQHINSWWHGIDSVQGLL